MTINTFFSVSGWTQLTYNVGGQFDEEDSDAAQWQRHTHGDVDQIWSQLRNVFG